MTKVRIDVPGYEAFDGFLGTLEFKGGVSVRPATDREVKQIGANIRIVGDNSDEQVGPSVVMVGSRHVSAVVEAALETEQEQPEVEVSDGTYSEEDLMKIGEDGGIKAVRAIANEYGIKGVAIADLITEILAAQKKA